MPTLDFALCTGFRYLLFECWILRIYSRFSTSFHGSELGGVCKLHRWYSNHHEEFLRSRTVSLKSRWGDRCCGKLRKKLWVSLRSSARYTGVIQRSAIGWATNEAAWGTSATLRNGDYYRSNFAVTLRENTAVWSLQKHCAPLVFYVTIHWHSSLRTLIEMILAGRSSSFVISSNGPYWPSLVGYIEDVTDTFHQSIHFVEVKFSIKYSL